MVKSKNEKKVKKVKKKTRSQLIKELDKRYSLYIRLKDADVRGYCRCVTCNKVDYYKNMQNGHYLTRANYKYRRSDDNCFPQCVTCNVRLNGNYKSYTLFMIKKFWQERVEKRLGEIRSTTEIKSFELEESIEHYKIKVTSFISKLPTNVSTF